MPDAPPQLSLDHAFATVQVELADPGPDPWRDSPYRWIRALQTRTRGKAGELVVERWLRAHGFEVHRPRAADGGPGCDRVVNGHRLEIKMSTLWRGGDLRFSQLRDQAYEALVMLGVEPRRLWVWCVPKDVILDHATGQHTGAGATETRWLGFNVAAIPAWLEPYGGSEKVGLRALEQRLHR